MPNPWPLYIALGLMGAMLAPKLAMPFMPADLKEAFENPTTITFYKSDMNGRTCKQMAQEAKARGAHHWICWN